MQWQIFGTVHEAPGIKNKKKGMKEQREKMKERSIADNINLPLGGKRGDDGVAWVF